MPKRQRDLCLTRLCVVSCLQMKESFKQNEGAETQKLPYREPGSSKRSDVGQTPSVHRSPPASPSVSTASKQQTAGPVTPLDIFKDTWRHFQTQKSARLHPWSWYGQPNHDVFWTLTEMFFSLKPKPEQSNVHTESQHVETPSLNFS